MNTREEAIKYGLSFANTYVEAPFRDQNWQLVRVKGSKKAFLWVYEKDGFIHLNVKVEPEWRDFWREVYSSVIPGYHQNKKYWKIPKGHVATYGQVAAMAGNPKMSRAVGNALHKNPDPENIPCFRVVNSKGELAGAFAFGGEGEQAKRLEEDGVEVKNGKVDLKKFGINSN